MAKASEQFRQSDVTFWAILALVLGGIAVFGANVSAVIPSSILAGLHKSRIAGPSVDQLRFDVADLTEETRLLRQVNAELVARFALQEQSGNDVTRRVGALEVSIPKILEAVPVNAEIDRTNLTAAIGGRQALVYDAEGGSVMIRQQPMPGTSPPTQPLPRPIISTNTDVPEGDGFGVAVGGIVTNENARQSWDALSGKVGPLLLGMSPLVAETPSGARRIVVGPIAASEDATALCSRLEQVSIACLPMPFSGTALEN